MFTDEMNMIIDDLSDYFPYEITHTKLHELLKSNQRFRNFVFQYTEPHLYPNIHLDGNEKLPQKYFEAIKLFVLFNYAAQRRQEEQKHMQEMMQFAKHLKKTRTEMNNVLQKLPYKRRKLVLDTFQELNGNDSKVSNDDTDFVNYFENCVCKTPGDRIKKVLDDGIKRDDHNPSFDSSHHEIEDDDIIEFEEVKLVQENKESEQLRNTIKRQQEEIEKLRKQLEEDMKNAAQNNQIQDSEKKDSLSQDADLLEKIETLKKELAEKDAIIAYQNNRISKLKQEMKTLDETLSNTLNFI